jgi:hypothetical protein
VRRHHRERNETRARHGNGIGASIETGDVQPSRAHRFELRGVRLHRKKDDPLAGDPGQVIEKALPDLGIDGGILGRRIGEDERRRVDPVLRRLRRVRDHVAVRIGVAGIELELGHRQRRDGGNGDDRDQPCESKGRPHAVLFHVDGWL